MRPSPVRLKHYQLERLFIEPVAGYEADFKNGDPYPSFGNANFNIGVKCGETNDGKLPTYIIDLDLKGSPDGEKAFPYRFELSAQGIVQVHGEEDPETRRELAAVNGASLLYSALREILLTLSFRFPNGPVLLPSASFNDLRGNMKKASASIAGKNKVSAATKAAPLKTKRVKSTG